MENHTALVRELCKLPAETEWVEFKHNNFEPNMIGEDVSALANGAALADHPFAYMVWGINDRTHEIVGTTVDQQSLKVGAKQELENWLRSLLSDNVELDFINTEIDGKRLTILKIAKSVSRPVTFKKVEYVRVGSYTKKLADVPSRQTALWDKLRSTRFENGVASDDLSIEDVMRLLDTQAYFDRLNRAYPSTTQGVVDYLADEGLVERQDNGLLSITNAGAMLFAKRLADFPTLKRKAIRIIRYYGEDRLCSSKEEIVETGYAIDFDGILRLVSALTPSEEIVVSALREERNGYPALAIREAVANALIHQDFSVIGAGPMVEIFDTRMEISNPGAPMVEIMRIIDAPPRSRNETMAALMRRMRVCEEKGTGWDKIALSCELHELPAPKIRRYESGTRVTLYTSRPFAQISIEDREWACYMHACLRYVNNDSYMTNSSLRQRFGLSAKSQPTISKLIKRSVKDELIRPLDAETSPRYMRYVPSWS